MSEELARYESAGMELARKPEEVLAQAKEAAMALKGVISTKIKPVIINGEQYLEFEDWQTVGRFYGVTAKVVSTMFIDIGGVQGFEARAVALRNSDGMELSGADSMCLNDEANWKNRPLFMLRSMAQTRACAKALRNVLAWVVVLAGYRPTPAEEMEGIKNKEIIKEPQKKSNGQAEPESAKSQSKKLLTLVNKVTVQKKNKDGVEMKSPLYSILGHLDGNETSFKTFDKGLADLAASEAGTGVMVAIEYETDKYGHKALTVEIPSRERTPGEDG